MSKEHYILSDETYQVLVNHESEIAAEYGCNRSYIYGIKNQDNGDPFPHFKRLYDACVRAGAPVCHWDNAFAATRARYEGIKPLVEPIDCLTNKIHSNAETTARLVKALQDGRLDDREISELRQDIKKERDNLDLLDIVLDFQAGLNVKSEAGKQSNFGARVN